MACDQTNVQNWENCAGGPMGLIPYPGLAVPASIDSLYRIVAIRNKPAGASANFPVSCEANLRARGLIYMKSRPGDCGSPAGVPSFSTGQAVGLSGTAASGVIGGLGTLGVLSGPATLGIGTAVSVAVAGIEGIFQHHTQAVANEESTICAVAGYFNPLVKEIDAMVMHGEITPDQAITYMRQVGLQAINGLQSIAHSCNAACYFVGYIKAHIDLASSLYPALSAYGPGGRAAQAPGSAPATFGTPPGAVPDSGAIAPLRSTYDPNFQYAPSGPPSVVSPTAGYLAPPVTPNKILPSGNTCHMGTSGALGWTGAGCSPSYLNIGYNQQTGQSAQAADVPATDFFSMTNLLIILAVVILLAVIL